METHHRWQQDIPYYFATSPSVRNNIFSLACLMLWPRTNYKEDLTSSSAKTFLLQRHLERDISHILLPMGEGRNPEESLLSMTLLYFDQAMVFTRQHLKELNSKPSYTCDEVTPFFFNGSIFYVYIGLSPNIVMPLFDDTSEIPMDLMLYSLNYSDIFRRAEGGSFNSYMGDPILERKVENYVNFEHKKWKSKFISQFRNLLTETYYGNILFPEITSRSCFEYAVFEEHLNRLEYTIKVSIDGSLPVPMFEFPFMIQSDFVLLARERNPFAHRILLAYSILCIYGGFFMLRHLNMWAAYIQWYESTQDLDEFDQQLLKFVRDLNRKPDFEHFRSYMLDFEDYWDNEVDYEVPDYPPIM